MSYVATYLCLLKAHSLLKVVSRYDIIPEGMAFREILITFFCSLIRQCRASQKKQRKITTCSDLAYQNWRNSILWIVYHIVCLFFLRQYGQGDFNCFSLPAGLGGNGEFESFCTAFIAIIKKKVGHSTPGPGGPMWRRMRVNSRSSKWKWSQPKSNFRKLQATQKIGLIQIKKQSWNSWLKKRAWP